jgi:2-polyprenyl-3-methyl-5-hydroxy-6-metoxy-1,4-benzoquinol methylase
MKIAAFDAAWPDAVKQVHLEHQQFEDPSVAPNIYSWYWQRLRFLSERLERFAPQARRILDIGCAQGSLAIHLGEKGLEVTGNDIRDSYIQYAKLRDDRGCVDFQVGNFVTAGYREQFDAVFFTEVIEHLVDHDEFLQKIRDALKPGGALFVTTPNQEYFRERLPSFTQIDLAANKSREFSAHGEDHFYLFKKNELIDLFERNRFSVLHHEYFLPFLQHGPLKMSLLWRVFPRSLMEAVSRPFDGINRLCAQQCLIVQKPA